MASHCHDTGMHACAAELGERVAAGRVLVLTTNRPSNLLNPPGLHEYCRGWCCTAVCSVILVAFYVAWLCRVLSSDATWLLRGRPTAC